MGTVVGAQQTGNEVHLRVRLTPRVETFHHQPSVEEVSDVGGQTGADSVGLTVKPDESGKEQRRLWHRCIDSFRNRTATKFLICIFSNQSNMQHTILFQSFIANL